MSTTFTNVNRFQGETQYRLANKRVMDFGAIVMLEHRAAMECLDCEEMLQVGIHASGFIEAVEATAIDALVEGVAPFSREEMGEAITALYQGWLHRAEKVEYQINQVCESGHVIRNLPEFRMVHADVLDRFEKQQWKNAARRSRKKRLASEPW